MASVRKIKTKAKSGNAKSRYSKRKSKMNAAREKREALKGLELPDGPKERVEDLNLFSWLVYGAWKIGKTTFFASFPDSMFLTTELGTKGMRITEFNEQGGGVTDWDHMLRAVDLLEEDPDRYKCVIIDTADNAFEFCVDYVVDKMGIPALGLTEDGKKDFGVSYRAVKREFNKAIQRILRLGMGVHFTSHAKEVKTETRSGEDYSTIVPSLSKTATDVVGPLVDHIWYVEYMKAGNKDVRVMVTQGSELITAGTREMTDYEIPKFLPLLKRGGFDMVEQASQGEDVGLDPVTLKASKKSGKKINELVTKELAGEKGRALRKRRSKKVKVKRR